MSLCNFRTFTIILVLELAVFESQVEGFSIQRTTEVPSDPIPAESTHLEVRNDLRRNVKPIETKTDSPPLTVPIQTTAKTEEIQKNVIPPTKIKDADTKSTSAAALTTEYKTLTSSKKPTPSKSSIISTNIALPRTSVLTTASSTSMITTEDESDDYSSKINKEENTLSTTWSMFENIQEITTENITTARSEILIVNSTKKANQVNTTDKINSTEKLNTTKQVNVTQNVNNSNQVNNTKLVNGTNQVNATAQINTRPAVAQNISAGNNDNIIKNMITWLSLVNNNTTTNEIKLKTEENNATNYSTKAVKVNDTAVGKITKNMNVDGSQNVKDTTDTNDSLSTTLSFSSNSAEKRGEEKEVNESSTEALTGDYSEVTAVPYWKKYTTIERKRVNITKDSEISTERDQDLLQSGTAQTQTSISLEKALNIISDIPSLEQLKNDLLALNKMSSTTEGMKSTKSLETKGTTTPVGAVILSEGTTSPLEAATQGFSVVSSKRAGFLDFSSRPVNSTEITKIQAVNVSEVPWNYSNPSKPQTTPRTYSEPKSMTSQSQLAEDAINEELMKEEVLNDYVENAKRLQEDRFGARTKPMINMPPAPTTGTKPDTSSEDKLRVRPISAEKLKNGSLYTVNPNYKPLKKIEVLPPKPFVRNPDDNSWRNESLSSLGIVFKANNSSKPFTQVLKNKTETELNSLLERYNKGDGPELRTRLEKIAEMRKTKKKKVNSLGETVYTDYEETVSGENTNSSKFGSFEYNSNIRNTSSVSDQVKMIRPMTTTGGYTFDDFEVTTKKAQKLLDEYEDEDEEDYTLPNIDLKKYFTPTSAPALLPSIAARTLTSPPIPLTVQTYPPDRRPTVQYFPPRDKPQKVVINDYDTVFRQKINAYTYNAPPKITNPVPQSPATEVTFNFPKNKFEQQSRPNDIGRRPEQMDRNIYLTQPSQDPKNTNVVVNPPQDVAGYNQASYVIKHLRDIIDEVVKADENPTATEESLRGVTVNNMVRENPKPSKDYYDYEAQFRKDVINRFVENFNQNSERFKADFPILYNTSVVHSPGLPGIGGAESTAFMKRLYDDVQAFQQSKDQPKRYDPHCDRMVELSPAYELHYYVPEEEEKEEVELKPITTPPHRLRL